MRGVCCFRHVVAFVFVLTTGLVGHSIVRAAQQAPPAGAPPPPAPMVKENATLKISDHIYVIPDMKVTGVPNVGMIVGQRGTLVVDTGMGTKNGEAVVRELRKVSSTPELYIATTHVHAEHDLGAGAFPPTAKMIRSRAQQREIEEMGAQIVRDFSRNPVWAELLQGATYRKADISFDREHRLDLGGVTVRIMAMGANHTAGDTAFYVEPDRVLFGGDIAMFNLPVFMSPASTVRSWLASLDRYGELKPSKVVPSHGTVGDAQLIADSRAFLQTVQKRVADLKASGKTLEETTAIIDQELQAQYAQRQPSRIAGAVKLAYNEIR